MAAFKTPLRFSDIDSVSKLGLLSLGLASTTLLVFISFKGNKSISTLVQQSSGRLVPIEQAEAMKILHPSLESATIPEVMYLCTLNT